MVRILVIGGAGFIGSFLVDRLIDDGHEVCIYDNLDPQVHLGKVPPYLNPKAEFMKKDVLDREVLSNAVRDTDVILHHGAKVGIGQSMYQIERYINVNTLGTATLLDILVNEKHNVKKLIVASSMTVYGEGAYQCWGCGIMEEPEIRAEEQMVRGEWEFSCPSCGSTLMPVPTPETKRMGCSNVYALSKMDQEVMSLMVGKTYGIPTVALRYFNVFGPRQSLSNPYTGVTAIFMSRIKNDHRPVIYEDGLQTRDFVSVHDVVQANILAMKKSSADYEAFNVGTGTAVSIKKVAEVLAGLYGKNITPEITGKFRKRDVRHCVADISKIKKIGYRPEITFEEGIKELAAWAQDQEAMDKFHVADMELRKKGLL